MADYRRGDRHRTPYHGYHGGRVPAWLGRASAFPGHGRLDEAADHPRMTRRTRPARAPVAAEHAGFAVGAAETRGASAYSEVAGTGSKQARGQRTAPPERSGGA